METKRSYRGLAIAICLILVASSLGYIIGQSFRQVNASPQFLAVSISPSGNVKLGVGQVQVFTANIANQSYAPFTYSWTSNGTVLGTGQSLSFSFDKACNGTLLSVTAISVRGNQGYASVWVQDPYTNPNIYLDQLNTGWVVSTDGLGWYCANHNGQNVYTSTNATLTINYALNNGYNVYTTSGLYSLTGTIILNSYNYLHGAGINSTIFQVQTGSSLINIMESVGVGSSDTEHITLSDFTIDGNYKTISGSGLKLQIAEPILSNLCVMQVKSSATYGAAITMNALTSGTPCTLANHILLKDGTNYGLFLSGADQHWTDCIIAGFHYAGQAGIVITSSDNFFTGLHIYLNNNGIVFWNGPSGNCLVNCELDNNNGTAITLVAGNSFNNFIGGRILSNNGVQVSNLNMTNRFINVYGYISPDDNLAYGITPTAAGWTSAPTNLAYSTDGDWTVGTGAGTKNSAAWDSNAGSLTFDLVYNYTYCVNMRLTVSSNVTCTANLAVQSSLDGSNYQYLCVSSGPKVTLSLTAAAQTFTLGPLFGYGRYLKLLWTNGGTIQLLSVTTLEVKIIKM